MHSNGIDLREHFSALHQDGLVWKAKRLWQVAADPDEQAAAIEELVKMLCCITNEVKRNAYIDKVCDGINGQSAEVRQNIEVESAKLLEKQKLWDQLQKKKKKTDEDLLQLGILEQELPALNKKINELKSIKLFPIQVSVVKKQVTEEQKRRKAEVERKKMNAEFEKKIQSAQDAGLPDDFNGSMEKIFDAIEYGIYVHKDKYWSKGSNAPISNFTMRIIYHTDTGEDRAYRMVAIKNVYGREITINMNTDDFVSLGSFKKIISRKGDFIFKGNDNDLSRLQEYLQKDETSAKYVDTLGYNKRGSFWAWGNGIVSVKKNEEKVEFMPVDDHGIVQLNDKHYFIPACSKMYEEKDNQFVTEKKFVYREAPKNFDFKEWNQLFLEAYLPDKAIPATLHYIGALFRDIIMRKYGRYPILNLFGPPQAGKGKMAESLMSLFGHRQDQIMLGGASTAVGFMRKFAQLRNAYVWLDEYKNSLPFKIIESIKNIFDGVGYERGKMSNDLQTETTEINSSCILSGQEMPTGEAALFTRIILLSFNDGKNRTWEQKDAFDKLKDIENDGGLSFITSRIVQYRPLVEELFEKHFKALQFNLSRRLTNPLIEDRFIDNISMLLAIRKVFDHILSFAFTYEQAEEVMIANITNHQLLKQGNDDLSKFWRIVESLFYRNEIVEERDFKLENGLIFLRLQTVHTLYVKEMIAQRDMTYLTKPTLEHYLQLDKNVFVDYRRKRFDDGSHTWCFVFRYTKLGIDLIKADDKYGHNLGPKYKEMGLEFGNKNAPVDEEEDPFPRFNN